MKQTEKFQEAFKQLKNTVKVSAVLGKNSTYIKSSGIEFNGIKNGDLTPLDVKRLKDMIMQVRKDVALFELALNEGLGNES